jgi:hypothetical protein
MKKTVAILLAILLLACSAAVQVMAAQEPQTLKYDAKSKVLAEYDSIELTFTKDELASTAGTIMTSDQLARILYVDANNHLVVWNSNTGKSNGSADLSSVKKDEPIKLTISRDGNEITVNAANLSDTISLSDSSVFANAAFNKLKEFILTFGDGVTAKPVPVAVPESSTMKASATSPGNGGSASGENPGSNEDLTERLDKLQDSVDRLSAGSSGDPNAEQGDSAILKTLAVLILCLAIVILLLIAAWPLVIRQVIVKQCGQWEQNPPKGKVMRFIYDQAMQRADWQKKVDMALKEQTEKADALTKQMKELQNVAADSATTDQAKKTAELIQRVIYLQSSLQASYAKEREEQLMKLLSRFHETQCAVASWHTQFVRNGSQQAEPIRELLEQFEATIAGLDVFMINSASTAKAQEDAIAKILETLRQGPEPGPGPRQGSEANPDKIDELMKTAYEQCNLSALEDECSYAFLQVCKPTRIATTGTVAFEEVADLQGKTAHYIAIGDRLYLNPLRYNSKGCVPWKEASGNGYIHHCYETTGQQIDPIPPRQKWATLIQQDSGKWILDQKGALR